MACSKSSAEHQRVKTFEIEHNPRALAHAKITEWLPIILDIYFSQFRGSNPSYINFHKHSWVQTHNSVPQLKQFIVNEIICNRTLNFVSLETCLS